MVCVRGRGAEGGGGSAAAVGGGERCCEAGREVRLSYARPELMNLDESFDVRAYEIDRKTAGDVEEFTRQDREMVRGPVPTFHRQIRFQLN